MFKFFTLQEPECIKSFIISELKREGISSDDDMINNYGIYMKGWNIVQIYKKASSIKRTINSMRQKGVLIETSRIKTKIAKTKSLESHEVFYSLAFHNKG